MSYFFENAEYMSYGVTPKLVQQRDSRLNRNDVCQPCSIAEHSSLLYVLLSQKPGSDFMHSVSEGGASAASSRGVWAFARDSASPGLH